MYLHNSSFAKENLYSAKTAKNIRFLPSITLGVVWAFVRFKLAVRPGVRAGVRARGSSGSGGAQAAMT
jgi:hypothetical protein